MNVPNAYGIALLGVTSEGYRVVMTFGQEINSIDAAILDRLGRKNEVGAESYFVFHDYPEGLVASLHARYKAQFFLSADDIVALFTEVKDGLRVIKEPYHHINLMGHAFATIKLKPGEDAGELYNLLTQMYTENQVALLWDRLLH